MSHLADGGKKGAALWSTVTSGALSVKEPVITWSLRQLSHNDGISDAVDRCLTPHWVMDPSESTTAAADIINKAFYKTFVNKILEQVHNPNTDDSMLCRDIPLEIAAAKLLIINDSNVKTF